MVRTKEWATFGCAEKNATYRNVLKFSRRHLLDKRKLFYVVNQSAWFYKGRYKGFKIMHKDKPRQWSYSLINLIIAIRHLIEVLILTFFNFYIPIWNVHYILVWNVCDESPWKLKLDCWKLFGRFYKRQSWAETYMARVILNFLFGDKWDK